MEEKKIIVQLERFHLNGHIIITGFHPQSQKFKPEFGHFDTNLFQQKSI